MPLDDAVTHRNAAASAAAATAATAATAPSLLVAADAARALLDDVATLRCAAATAARARAGNGAANAHAGTLRRRLGTHSRRDQRGDITGEA